MRIEEQPAFDAEMHELLDKYRITLMGGIYISEKGEGEQEGVFACGKGSEIDDAFLAKLTRNLWSMLERIK
jgi:hypothetical protein